MVKDKSGLIVQATNPSNWKNVYVLGSFDRRITFYTQQVRAFELVKALFDTRRLTAGRRVIVIGGGAAGITAAVAAASKGCNVQLYEQGDNILNIQASSHRYLHPHIYRWPESESDNESAGLPLLNWSADSAEAVIEHLRKRFNDYSTSKYKNLISSRTNANINWIDQISAENNAAQVKVKDATGLIEDTTDILIVAIGFGLESTPPSADYESFSYWRNDGLEGPFPRRKTNILISGAGDGGLIDLARASLRDFRQDRFIQQIKTCSKFLDVAGQMQELDNELINEQEINLYIKYEDNIKVDTEILNKLKGMKRSDTEVVFNFQTSPFDLRSALINRLIAFLLIKGKLVSTRKGKINSRSVAKNNKGSLTVPIANDKYEFNTVVLRHGPQHDFFSSSFAEAHFGKDCIRDLSGKISELELTGHLDNEIHSWYQETTIGTRPTELDTDVKQSALDLFNTIDNIYVPLFDIPPQTLTQQHEQKLSHIFVRVVEFPSDNTRKKTEGNQYDRQLTDILNDLECNTGPTKLIQFRGNQGTGKSAAAASLDIVLRKRLLDGNLSLIPIRVDGGKYIAQYSATKNIKRKIIEVIQNDIQAIWRKANVVKATSKESKVVLLLYGVGLQNLFSRNVISNAVEAFTGIETSYLSGIIVALHDKFDIYFLRLRMHTEVISID